uniref:Calcium homeostasis modulator 3 n=1 Tax=Loxodonta africana TaxID=9785 RepID=G3UNJ7_LOXAF
AMDKFRLLFQHFQSSSESVMNGICLLLAAVTVKLYSSFDFNCPCLERYNALYGLGLLLTPPLALFLCGLLANRQSVVMVEEWRRPVGHRRKDPGIISDSSCSLVEQYLSAVDLMSWSGTTLLERQCLSTCGACHTQSLAPSAFPRPEKCPAFVPKGGRLFHRVPAPTLKSGEWSNERALGFRGLSSLLQAIGWSITLLLIMAAFLARCLRPCFDQTVLLQRRYWSNYVDLEQKLFDETCCEHARDFAHRCVLHFFASMQREMRARELRQDTAGRDPEPPEGPEASDGPEGGSGKAHLQAISSREQVDRLLNTWYSSKPPLNVASSPGLWGGG